MPFRVLWQVVGRTEVEVVPGRRGFPGIPVERCRTQFREAQYDSERSRHRQVAILTRREQIKRRTLQQRRRENLHTPPRAVNRQEVSLRKQAHWPASVLTTYNDSKQDEERDENEGG